MTDKNKQDITLQGFVNDNKIHYQHSSYPCSA